MLPHDMHFRLIENNALIPSYTKPFGHQLHGTLLFALRVKIYSHFFRMVVCLCSQKCAHSMVFELLRHMWSCRKEYAYLVCAHRDETPRHLKKHRCSTTRIEMGLMGSVTRKACARTRRLLGAPSRVDKGAKGVPSTHSAWWGGTVSTMRSMSRKTRLSSPKQDVGE